MIVLENDCVGCPKELGCLGKSCPYIKVPHYYCDRCGDEATLVLYDGDQLCESCAKKMIRNDEHLAINDLINDFIQEELEKLKEVRYERE